MANDERALEECGEVTGGIIAVLLVIKYESMKVVNVYEVAGRLQADGQLANDPQAAAPF